MSVRRAAGIALGALILTAGAAAPPAGAASGTVAATTVFQRGEDGYHTYRIPAVLRAADGTLLAFAEARRDDPDDNGNIDLVLKRSPDGGATWGPLQVVWNAGKGKAGNPVPILDERTGRIVLNATRTGGSVTGEDIICGEVSKTEARRAFTLTSGDNGATWSVPREITASVKLPEWRHFVGGPGHGTQLTHGKHAGRIVVPGNHSRAPAPGAACPDDRLFGGHALYSDDGGTTWHLGGVDEVTDGTVIPNETTATELADGTLYFNTRDQNGTSAGNRAATTSSDGGASFDAPYREVQDLHAPVIQGSVLQLSASADDRRRVVFSAPLQTTARRDLTLRLSSDGARTWQSGPEIHEGPAGYSDLVETDDGVGVLYENGTGSEPASQRISFAVVSPM